MTTLHLVCGPPGAGKTTRAQELAAEHGGVVFTIDDWLVTLYGPELPVPFRVDRAAPLIRRCEEQIWKLARRLLALEVDVILDLGFMLRFHRELYRARAREAGARALLHACAADVEVRRARVRERNLRRSPTYTIEVGDALFDAVDAVYEPPDAAELAT